ncbi:MAG: amidohydrolase family protein, partial [Halobacteriales archaeon]|nr:amidohydrolase family protein [Halobacteriales archaeon]
PTVWEDHLSGLDGRLDRDWTWETTTEYFDAIDASGIGPNVTMLVGHGTVRFNVLGMSDRAPTAAELAEMGDLVEEALDAGAVGLSTGLVYTPQTNADTAEVRALADRVAPYGRPFVAHIRSEREDLWAALDEFIDIGADTGAPLHLSHFKLGGPPQYGKADRATGQLEAARERGVDITADQYPYAAGSTTLSYILPPWVHAGGPEQALQTLQDPSARERIRRDIQENRTDGWENPGGYSGFENIVVTSVPSEANAPLQGKSVTDIAADRRTDAITAALDLLVEEALEVSIVNHVLSEEDVRALMQYERTGIATDGLFGGKPHPRLYGTYPRVLGRYVREENLFSLEEAVRKMTSLPARSMGLHTKGVLRPGMDADLVVFDPLTVGSTATYEDPHQFPTGLPQVLVDGTFVVRDGETTGATPGSVVRIGHEN